MAGVTGCAGLKLSQKFEDGGRLREREREREREKCVGAVKFVAGVKFFLPGCMAKSVRSPDRAKGRSTVDWACIESKQKRYVQAVIVPTWGVCDARVTGPGYTPTVFGYTPAVGEDLTIVGY